MVMINREEQFIMYFFKDESNEEQVYMKALYSILQNFMNRMVQDYGQYVEKQVRVMVQTILSCLEVFVKEKEERRKYLREMNRRNEVQWVGWEMLDAIVGLMLKDGEEAKKLGRVG